MQNLVEYFGANFIEKGFCKPDIWRLENDY